MAVGDNAIVVSQSSGGIYHAALKSATSTPIDTEAILPRIAASAAKWVASYCNTNGTITLPSGIKLRWNNDAGSIYRTGNQMIIHVFGDKFRIFDDSPDTYVLDCDINGIRHLTGYVACAALATGSRPSASTVGAGAMIFDTTLGQPIWSDGTNWVDATGATA